MARSRLTSLLVVVLVVVGSLTGGLVGATPGGRDSDSPGPDWPGPLTGPARIGDPSLLWLKSGTFDPVQDPIPVALGLRRASSEGLYLVQFESPLSDQLGANLEALGISVWSFIPEGGLVVSIPSPAVAIALSRDPAVRWSCPWQDGWKVHPSLEASRGQMVLSVTTWRYDIDVSRDLAKVGARVHEHLMDSYIVSVDASRIGDIAALRQVSWIEPWGEASFLMDNASVTVGARQADNETYDPNKGAIWSWVKDDEYFDGLGGTSVLVDVTDTGVDASHIAFAGRNRPFFKGIDPSMPVWTDPDGHGTVVAGILLGDGSYRLTEDPGDDTLVQGTYAGVAPDTYLMAQSLYGQGFTYTYRNLTKYSVEKGAAISHNSWGKYYPNLGAWGEYTDVAYDYDNSTRDADWTTPGDQAILVVFAAGNNGTSGSGTILASATGKNVITVGATGNDKGSTSSDEIWARSSRGPTNDGRIKPDLVAPGEYITSTWGIDDDGSNAAALPPDSGDASYITYNGTSMAAPIVSGSAALLIDHLGTNKGHKDPSPALVKSILIATADHLPGVQWPGNEQGWGRVNASRAILETSDRFVEWIDQSTSLSSPGETIAYKFDVTAGTPLTFSLVWTDIPGAVQAGKDLVNDLDMELLSPSGKMYRGNHISGGQSTEGGTADRTNNVEVTHFMTPEAGEWEVTVRANELPPVGGGGEQDFALVAVGNVQKKFVDIVAQNMSVRATDAAEGEVIPIAFDLTNEGKLPAGNVPWRLVLLDEEGEDYTTLDTGIDFLGPLAGVRLYANWTAVRGTYTAVAIPNIDRTIAEETYQNNDISKMFFIKGFGVNATLQLDVSAGDPGTDVSHTIEVTNTGNTEDRYLIERTPPPTGWDARLDSTVLSIDPGVTRTANLIVSIPMGAEAGTIVNIDISITSQGNTTYFIRCAHVHLVGFPVDRHGREMNDTGGEINGEAFVFHQPDSRPDAAT